MTDSEKVGHVWAHCLLLVRDFCTSVEQKEMVIELLLLQNLPLAQYCIEVMFQAAGGEEQKFLSKEKFEEAAVSSLIRAIQDFNPLRGEDFSLFAKEGISDDLLSLAMDHIMNPIADSWEDIASRKGGEEKGKEWEKFLSADTQTSAGQLELLEQKNDKLKVRELIALLPEEFMKQVMELRYVRDFGQKKVASQLGVKLVRVQGNEKRALIILRKILKAQM